MNSLNYNQSLVNISSTLNPATSNIVYHKQLNFLPNSNILLNLGAIGKNAITLPISVNTLSSSKPNYCFVDLIIFRCSNSSRAASSLSLAGGVGKGNFLTSLIPIAFNYRITVSKGVCIISGSLNCLNILPYTAVEYSL